MQARVRAAAAEGFLSEHLQHVADGVMAGDAVAAFVAREGALERVRNAVRAGVTVGAHVDRV